MQCPYTCRGRQSSLSLSLFLQVATWATEAFFKYGGDPHFIFPTTLGPAGQVWGSPGLQSPAISGGPNQYATPPPQGPVPTGPSYQQTPGAVPLGGVQSSVPGALGRALVGPEVQRSGKHNGLCCYLARLLRYM